MPSTRPPNAIKGRLTLDAGTGNVDTTEGLRLGATPERENGRQSASELVGMGMTLGHRYTGFDLLKVWLSNNDNAFFRRSTHTGVTYIDLGDEQPVLNGTNDVVNIASISGTTTIDAGNGNDVIRVNFDSQGKADFPQRHRRRTDAARPSRAATATRSAWRARSPRASTSSTSRAATRASTGCASTAPTRPTSSCCAPTRTSASAWSPRSRSTRTACRWPGGVIERINYDADISGAVEIFGRDGDDTFVLDDNLAPTDDLRRRRRRHLPDRPGLRSRSATAATRTTASRRRTTSRPRRSRAASCRTA
jgi:Ca2+-binding RTX toxin-like protein